MDLITYLSKTLNITPEQAAELAAKMPGFDPAHGASTTAINHSLDIGSVTVGPMPGLSIGSVDVRNAAPNLEMDPSSVTVANMPAAPRAAAAGLSGYLNVDQLPENVGAKAAEEIKLQALPQQELDRMDRMTEWANAWVNHNPRQVAKGQYPAEHTNPYDLSPGAILSTKGGPPPRPPTAHVNTRDIALKSAKEGVTWATDTALAATAGMMSPEKLKWAADIMKGRDAQDKLDGNYGKDKVKPETDTESGGSVVYRGGK